MRHYVQPLVTEFVSVRLGAGLKKKGSVGLSVLCFLVISQQMSVEMIQMRAVTVNLHSLVVGSRKTKQ